MPWSLWGNGLLAVALIVVLTGLDRAAGRAIAQAVDQVQQAQASLDQSPSTTTAAAMAVPKRSPVAATSYEGWVARRRQEADAMALRRPARLAVLVGDSLTLAFPSRLLPDGATWLNQGISGDTTRLLLRRLDGIGRLQPEVIFVAIGINDLLQGVSDDTIVENHRAIANELRRAHPNSRVVLQSLLPHRGAQSSWEGRDRLRTVTRDRLQRINRRLAQVARDERVGFLDLFPMFADSKGDLHPDLTTDGLHLSDRGYLVWRAALDSFLQLSRSSAASLNPAARPGGTDAKGDERSPKATSSPTPKPSDQPKAKPSPTPKSSSPSTRSPSPKPTTPADRPATTNRREAPATPATTDDQRP
ncbi:MAG TPA: GDSL-type esterase/lipase family protein [Coleofasciculaceae cyanobacterium]